jgi:eukaryotic-like serine/threonine-protein kinase
MAAQVITSDKLGVLTKIGQGGQGVVYGAPNVKTKFAAAMVFKEYKTAARSDVDFAALAAMPALVEESLSYSQAERLISIAAWPCAIVEDAGTPTGFVMPAIPDEFFVPLSTVKGVSTTAAEFQHLLNHPTVLVARGITIDDAQRFSLLRETASALAFLHRHGVCVGDISPKNLLFSLTPHDAVYFIDCDAMRINGVSALAQVETPGWQVPAGEELATIYSDTYKLGLLALRLCAGDHDTTNPDHLPATTPALLRQLVIDTLAKPPQQRPLPEAWSYVLGHAIEEAQHRKLTAPTAPVAAAGIAAPEIPTVHSRPSAKTGGYSQPPASAPPPRQPAGQPGAPVGAWTQPPNKSSSSTGAILAVVGVALVVAVIVLTIVLVKNHDSSSQAASAAAYPTYSSAAAAAPTQAATVPVAAAPPVDPQAAALAQLQQYANGDREYARDQLAERWVPQLSSKRQGLYDAEDGITYDNASILQEHLRLRSRFDAKLLWSGDWANFDGSNFWVSVANVTFNDSASALAWCRNQDLDADHCYAGVISETHSGHTAHN